jgi:hypothetical protein
LILGAVKPCHSPLIQIIQQRVDVTPQRRPGGSAHHDYDYDVDGEEDERRADEGGH